MAEKRDYGSILFTPEQAGVMTADYLRTRKDYKAWGIPFGVGAVDQPSNKKGEAKEFYVPLMPGELETVIARPGHGKTGTMVARARRRADYLKAAGMKDRAVVYVTLEQSVEELNAFNIAADRHISITDMAMGEIGIEEWKACLEEGIRRRYTPIWNIGYRSTPGVKQIRIDLDGIAGALHMIEDLHKQKIDLVFIDYLQRIPFDRNTESKTIGVSDNLDGLKTMALQVFKCPLVTGAQAVRDVDNRGEKGGGLPIPAMDDGQWTSNIEQTSDHVISLVRPRKYKAEGEDFGSMKVQGHCQMLVSVLKQKLGASNFARWVMYDPIYNILDNLEMQKQGPRL